MHIQSAGGESNLDQHEIHSFRKTILILPASSESILSSRWKKELTKIRDAVNRGNKGSKRFDVEERHYASSSDLSEELTSLKPYIIHISGCTDGIESLVLRNTREHINAKEKNELIAEFFGLHERETTCLLLSGCSSEEQVREIAQNIDFVIAITKNIEEIHAINFINEFYYQLTSGREIRDSYNLGRNLLEREGSGKSTLPQFFTKKDEIRRRDLERKLNSCIKEIEKNQENITSWEKKASLLTDLGRIDEANEAYEKASLLDPQNYNIRVQQGDTLELFGDHEKANFAYDKALDLEEKDYKIWWKKAKTLIEIGKDQEAGECYKKSLSLLPPSPYDYVICSEYGAILEKLGLLYEGVLLYGTSLCLQPKYRAANYYKKQVYKKIYSQKRQHP